MRRPSEACRLLGFKGEGMAILWVFGAAETETVVFHLRIEKTAVEGGCAEPASVRQAVEP